MSCARDKGRVQRGAMIKSRVRNPLFIINTTVAGAATIALVGSLLCDFISGASAASGTVGLSSTSFLGGQGKSGRDSLTLTGLDLNLAGEGALKAVPIKAKGSGEILFGLNDSRYRFFEVPEGFLSSKHEEIAIGRKKNTYSELDETWALGITQGQFQWDYLHPESIGLLGLHLQEKISGPSGSFTVRGVYSPFFIPNRGSPVDFRDGRVSSVLPWAVNPPETLTLQGKPVDIRYRAVVPPLSKLLTQTTMGGQIVWNENTDESKGIQASMSYFYKPMNTLLFSYEPYYNLDKQTAEVALYPRVAHHHVFTADIAERFKGGAASLSMLYENPIDALPKPTSNGIKLSEFGTVKTTRTSQQVSSSTLLSPSLAFSFPHRDLSEGALKFSYLKRLGKNLPDVGDQADGTSSFFDSPIRFSDAALAQIQFPQWHSFSLEGRAIYDLKNPSSVLSGALTYRPQASWSIYGLMDVLTSYEGTAYSKSTTEGPGFITRFSNNDRFMTGVSYVF